MADSGFVGKKGVLKDGWPHRLEVWIESKAEGPRSETPKFPPDFRAFNVGIMSFYHKKTPEIL